MSAATKHTLLFKPNVPCYDIGIMSGAKRLVLRDLGLATEQVEVLVGSLNLVSGFGGLAAGRLADGVGRRRTGALARRA